MKINEAINKLIEIKKEHGEDIDVNIFDREEWFSVLDIEYMEYESDELFKLAIIK
jgi:hypothetical protein